MNKLVDSKLAMLAVAAVLVACSSSSSGDDTAAAAGGSSGSSSTAGSGGSTTAGSGGSTTAGSGGSTAGAGGSAAGAGGSTAGAGGTTGAPTCADYCTTIAANCTGDNAAYTPGACATICPSFPAGTAADVSGDTLGCRAYHAAAASGDPALHCPHAGVSGGGVCGTDACEAFCDAALTVCTGALAPYASKTECQTACAKFPPGSGPLTKATGGDTLLCRTYHLEAAAASTAAAMTHCGHTAAVSAVCK